ncbi:MAG: helix-turn-helix domain-containing protein [Rhodobacteraceae bacterium]|nr:helix-turn-helix domain-containing protein [Paracoccaceae bacterium]
MVLALGAVVAILAGAAFFLIYSLPDADAFNNHVERLFVENKELTSETELRLLEILAQSGSAFSDTLASYRMIVLVLFAFAAALLIAAAVFLLNTVALGRRVSEVERAGMHVRSLILRRDEQVVLLNDLDLELTPAAMETLAALCEARLDDEVLSGSQLESLISGKDVVDCEDAAGATRVKRLRDALGNQIMTRLLIKNITKNGYVLAINKEAIKLN